MNRHSLGPFGVLEKVVGLHYDEPSAEDAWTRILRFFDIHLRAPAQEAQPGAGADGPLT